MTSKPTAINQKWTGGNAMPWVLGVTLGLILGLILLIAIPRMLGGKPAASTAATTSAPASSTATAATSDATSTAADSTAPAAGAATAGAASSTDQPASAGGATEGAAGGAGDAAAGKEKFAGTCAGCHGANAEGAVGPDLRPTNSWTPEQFASAVREGKTPDKTLAAMMPHFTAAQLSDAELANVHAFIKSLN